MDFLDTYDAAARLWGPEQLREIWGGTYDQNPATCRAHAIEALRNPKPLTDPRRLRAGSGLALAAGDRVAIIRIEPVPEALELAQRVAWP